MGAIVGVVIGYAFGVQSGEKGWEETREAWKVISTSEEVRDLLSAGVSMARDLLARGGGLFGGGPEDSEPQSGLRSVA